VAYLFRAVGRALRALTSAPHRCPTASRPPSLGAMADPLMQWLYSVAECSPNCFFLCLHSVKYYGKELGLTGEEKNILPGKLPWEKFCPKFRDSIFLVFLRIGAECIPGILRIVGFLGLKSPIIGKTPSKISGASHRSIFNSFPIGWDSTFPRQNKDWNQMFPPRYWLR
jgi:hypothetical protein